MQNISLDMDSFESDFGTPTAQKLIKILVSWSALSLQDLINKSHMSKSQVHITLKKLLKHNIVYSPSRGVYNLLDSPFTNLLKEAYRVKIIEVINSEVYQVKQLLKTKQLDAAEVKFNELVEQYHPVLQESFTTILSSLSIRFIDAMKRI